MYYKILGAKVRKNILSTKKKTDYLHKAVFEILTKTQKNPHFACVGLYRPLRCKASIFP